MFKSFILTGSILVSISVLTGCTPPEPTQFGMAQSQFQQLPTDQQSQVIDNYGQQQRLDSQEATLENVADTVAQVIGAGKSPATAPSTSPGETDMAQMQAQADRDQAAFLQRAATMPTGHYESNTSSHHSSMKFGII